MIVVVYMNRETKAFRGAKFEGENKGFENGFNVAYRNIQPNEEVMSVSGCKAEAADKVLAADLAYWNK